MKLWGLARKTLGGIVAVALTLGVCAFGQSKPGPVDPGVRGGPAGAGTSLKGLTADELRSFRMGTAGSLKSRLRKEARTMGSGPASTPTSVCLATRSRLWGERAWRKIP